jgi:hypothetical protein
MSVVVTGDGIEYIKSIRVGSESEVWAGAEVGWRELEGIVVWKWGGSIWMTNKEISFILASRVQQNI